MANFYSRPCGRGDAIRAVLGRVQRLISTHAPAGGATSALPRGFCNILISTHAPAGGATRCRGAARRSRRNFYSRPCGRGDTYAGNENSIKGLFLLTPLREGRRKEPKKPRPDLAISTHAPAGGATKRRQAMHGGYANFYSRPCGRGDEADVCGRNAVIISTHAPAGGATYKVSTRVLTVRCISTHAPAGGATWMIRSYKGGGLIFLLTPLREGRLYRWYRKNGCGEISTHAPAGGATWDGQRFLVLGTISTHAPAGGATRIIDASTLAYRISTHAPAGGATRSDRREWLDANCISTHAPAGGATAIFHKSVMRFCGKLPKDDTVLCLASFGFPRRDPKAVYLA